MYHEGWWGGWTNAIPYVLPIAFTLIPTLVAFRLPTVGGIIIIGIGTFTFFFFSFGVAVIGLSIFLIGVLFVIEGIIKRRSLNSYIAVTWWHDWRYLVLISALCIILVSVSAFNLPVVLTRQDDGDRGTRLIEGNGVTLIWAPEGPGWNWRQPWGGYPSWQSIALYGMPPVGLVDKPGYGKQEDDSQKIHFATPEDMAMYNLCRYLSADGLTLVDEAQDIWRMPTTDEMVRSLGRHGMNAGCEWWGEFSRRVKCSTLPDKESPLWSTDVPVIYYWTSEGRNENQGYFVAYNGTVNAAYKLGGNPRHGYRCVKEF